MIKNFIQQATGETLQIPGSDNLNLNSLHNLVEDHLDTITNVIDNSLVLFDTLELSDRFNSNDFAIRYL